MTHNDIHDRTEKGKSSIFTRKVEQEQMMEQLASCLLLLVIIQIVAMSKWPKVATIISLPGRVEDKAMQNYM